MNSLFTARLRTGITMDNLMLYLTGGIAGARFKTEYSQTGFDGFTTGDISEWRWGWVAGFGTEWAWTQNLSIKSEVLYANFTDREHRVFITTPVFSFPANFTHSDQVWISRIGLNYRFGGYAPVAAKY